MADGNGAVGDGDDVEGEVGPDDARILAVDDTPANLITLHAVLDPLGLEIVTANSGVMALARAAETEFAVALIDVMMPGMDGIATLEALRKQPKFKDTPVLLMTAFEPDARAIQRAYSCGAADYVAMPVAPTVLRAKVEVFVSLYRRGLELRRRGAALAAKDRYIAMLAHDLRTPLTTIEIVADSMARGESSPRQQADAARVLRAARRMEAMTGDLLDFARMSAGTFPLTREPIDPSLVIHEVIEELGAAHPDRPITMEIEEDLHCVWDRARVQQALSNLIVNAIKYGTGPIVVRAQRRGPVVELSVWNDGEPIPEARIGRIFEPFERGREGGSGLGLGLYVVREIARAHSGSISVSSSRGQGTTFTLSLPEKECQPGTPGDAPVEHFA